MIRTSYLNGIFNNNLFKKNVKDITDFLKTRAKEFDGFVIRGMSSAIITGAVAARLRKPVVLIRKDDDSTHSETKIEGYNNVKRYVFIHDFISIGQTVDIVRNKMHCFNNGKMMGIVLFHLHHKPNNCKSFCKDKNVWLYISPI